VSSPIDTRGLPRGWRWAGHNEAKCVACGGTGHKKDHPRWFCAACNGWGVEFSTEMLR